MYVGSFSLKFDKKFTETQINIFLMRLSIVFVIVLYILILNVFKVYTQNSAIVVKIAQKYHINLLAIVHREFFISSKKHNCPGNCC